MLFFTFNLCWIKPLSDWHIVHWLCLMDSFWTILYQFICCCILYACTSFTIKSLLTTGGHLAMLNSEGNLLWHGAESAMFVILTCQATSLLTCSILWIIYPNYVHSNASWMHSYVEKRCKCLCAMIQISFQGIQIKHCRKIQQLILITMTIRNQNMPLIKAWYH